MRAAVLEKIGTTPKFRIKELPSPLIKTGQLLVRNRASSVNPVDTIMQQGKSLLATAGITNQVIGSDFCGVVIASESRRFKAGDEVFGTIPVARGGGAYAEEIAVHEDWVALKPVNLNYLEAGVIPLVGLTAFQALFKIGKLQRNENVLITGCTGGVGSAAVQLAKSVDAYVSGVCSESHREHAKSIGCDVVIDYNRQKIPSEAQFDLVFDAAGKYTYSGLQHHLGERAYFVTTRGDTDSLKGMVRTAVDMVLEKRMKFVMVKSDADDLSQLKQLAERGQLKLPIAATFPLEGLTEAQEMMKKGGFIGKLGISI